MTSRVQRQTRTKQEAAGLCSASHIFEVQTGRGLSYIWGAKFNWRYGYCKCYCYYYCHCCLPKIVLPKARKKHRVKKKQSHHNSHHLFLAKNHQIIAGSLISFFGGNSTKLLESPLTKTLQAKFADSRPPEVSPGRISRCRIRS